MKDILLNATCEQIMGVCIFLMGFVVGVLIYAKKKVDAEEEKRRKRMHLIWRELVDDEPENNG